MGEPRIEQQNILSDRFPFTALIMPHEPEPEDNTTFSPAVVRRSVFRQDLELRRPPKDVATTLQRVGLKDLDKLQAIRESASEAGVFAQLGSLGMTVAFFGDDRYKDHAIGELEDQYEFAPNFNLSLPPPVRLEDAPATRSQTAINIRDWPAESGVARAHEMGIRGAGVLIGVLDTGVDADHQEFADQTVTYRYVSLHPNSPYFASRDVRGFDTDGHGTHVSGIIAGRNVGVAPEASLYVASVIESQSTLTSILRVTSGVDWLISHFLRRRENDRRIAILNMSLGFPSTVPRDTTPEMFDHNLLTLRRLLRTLIEANVLPIVAIGNYGAGGYGYPGAFDDVLAVGAVDFDGRVSNVSGSGQPERNPKPDLVGYGVSISSSVERDYEGSSVYQRETGTSMAAPYATGIAALYLCQQPALTMEQVRAKLLDNVLNLPTEDRTRVGVGLARFVP